MLKVFNSFSDKLEDFVPQEPNRVKMYVCGPTVYDLPHLGHARCYLTWDMVYRYLKFSGYDVVYCRNVTDVDDKILAKADEQGVSPDEIAQKYYEIFSSDMKRLNILRPDFEPFATKCIGEMIAMVKHLMENGFAYAIDGDVYFRVKNFSDYGKLSKQPLDALVAGDRAQNIGIKEDPLDFALWKKDEKHGFKSPWGLGRPGWHIECSAMSKKHLGETIDIHAGGADLIFPHHENEIAQSECANGQKYVKYWLHNGFVTINNTKMSKSLNNFVTIDSMLNAYDADTIRFFVLTNHYRMPIEFNDESLLGAQAGVKRLKNAINDVLNFIGEVDIKNSDREQLEEVQQFTDAMNDDFNTSKALAVLFDLANKANRARDEEDKAAALKYTGALIMLSEVLGFELKNKSDIILSREVLDEFDFLSDEDKNKTLQEIMQKIIEKRNSARESKDWAVADKIRNTLDSAGIVIKDTKTGSTFEMKCS